MESFSLCDTCIAVYLYIYIAVYLYACVPV